MGMIGAISDHHFEKSAKFQDFCLEDWVA